MSEPSSSSSPLPPNPILTAYEGWVQKTPWATRALLMTQVGSYLASWFLPHLHFALSVMPYFTLLKGEIYRLVTSSWLVNTSIFSLLIAFWSLTDVCQRLEYSIGSTALLWLSFMMGLLTQLLFLIILVVTYLLTQQRSVLFMSSAGIWTVAFGLLALDASHYAQHQGRQAKVRILGALQVPVLYYPTVLYLIFSLLSADFSLAHLISLALGYSLGHAHRLPSRFFMATWLEAILRPSPTRFRAWEESSSSLALFCTRQAGFVPGHASTGVQVWQAPTNASSSSGGNSLATSGFWGSTTATSTAQTGANASTSLPSSSSSSTTAFSHTAGRTLGGSSASHRSYAVDARQARLDALERRSAAASAATGAGSQEAANTRDVELGRATLDSDNE